MKDKLSAVTALLKENKKSVAIIIGVLIVVTGLFFVITSPKKGTLGYEARHQQVAPKKAMKNLIADQQAGKKKDGKANTTIFVFYKNNCPVCKREGKRVIQMLHNVKKQSTGDVTVTYINAKHGVPDWFKKHYGLVLGDVKTPYIFELRSDLYETHNADKDNVKFYPVARGRLVNKDAITYAQSSLISGSQLQHNQIYQLDNINNSVNN